MVRSEKTKGKDGKREGDEDTGETKTRNGGMGLEMVAEKRIRLTDRDLLVMNFLNRFGVVNERHLVKLCGLDENQYKSFQIIWWIVGRLRKGGYVTRTKVFNEQPALVTIAEKGGDLLDTNPTKIRLHTTTHDMLTIDLFFELQKRGVSNIITERERRIELGYRQAKKEAKIPDILVNNSEAYEVEISEKNKERMRRIILHYASSASIQKVVYYVKSRGLGQRIYQMGGSKFEVYLFDGIDIKKAVRLARHDEEPAEPITAAAAAAGINLDAYRREPAARPVEPVTAVGTGFARQILGG